MEGQRNVVRLGRPPIAGMVLSGVITVLGLFGIGTPLQAAGNRASNQIGRQHIPLTEDWCIKQLDTDKPDVAALVRESASPDKTWLAARMPAQVHDVLLAHGLIADPHVGKNAAACAWVGEKDWAYVCRFPTPEKIAGPVFLRFGGLDTLADAWLNGVPIGHFENMFREYAIEVSRHLAPSGQPNTLVIVFSAPLRFARAARLSPKDPNPAGHLSLRKCHSDFSSYLGASPHAVKVGIYRDVVLDLPDRSWIDDVWVRSELSPDFRSARQGFDGSVRGRLETEVAVKPGEARRSIDLTPLGEISLRSEFLRATYCGRDVTYLLLGERQLHLPQSHLTVRRNGGGIEITADVFARQVTIQFDGIPGAVIEDNCFDLAPKQKRTIRIVDAVDGRNLTVRALNSQPVTIPWIH